MENIKIHNDNLLVRLVKNSFFLITSRIIDIAAVIITTPIVARYLGLTAFGDYAIAMAVGMFLQPLVDFGFERIVCRDVARKNRSANETVNSAIIVRLLLSVCIIFIAYLIVEQAFSSRELKIAVVVSITTEIMISFAAFYLAVVKAYERMEYELISNFAHRIAFIAAILTAIFFDLGFLWLFYARLFSSFIFVILAIFFVYRRFITFRWRISIDIAKLLFQQSYPIAIFAFMLTASFKIDVFFLKYFGDSSDVALFEASHRLIMHLQFIPLSIAFSVFPFLSKKSEEDPDSLNSYYEKTLKFFYIFSILPTMLMVLGADELIYLLFGEEFMPSASALKILAGTFVFLAMVTLQHNMLIILGKQRSGIISVAACFIVNCLLDYTIVPRYGYIGASIATFVSYFILFVSASYFVYVNIGKINIARVLVKPTVSVLLTGVVFYVVLNGTIISLIIAFILGLPAYFIALLALKTFSDSELISVKGIMFKKKRRMIPEGNSL